MRTLACCLARFLHVFGLFAWLFITVEADSSVQEKTVAEKKLEWGQLSRKHHDSTRATTVRNVLRKAAGVYTDVTKSSAYGLDDTVIINVIESNDNPSDKYKQFLKNLLCFEKQYGMRSIVYLVDSNSTRFAQEAQLLRDFSSLVEVLPYPYEQFWLTVAQKNNSVIWGIGKGDYQGDIPTYSHFGALFKLIPVYEALLLGFNVIYFDVDIALVRDPLPYMMRTGETTRTTRNMANDSSSSSSYNTNYTGTIDADSTPDLVLALEMRSCNYAPSLFGSGTNWHSLEPNTGTMLVRSTPASIRFFSDWLQRIVTANDLNDQKTWDLSREEYTDSCTARRREGSRESVRKRTTKMENRQDTANSTKEVEVEANGDPRRLRFCYLSEYMFQNGLMEFYCSHGKRQSSSSAYNLGMERNALLLTPSLQQEQLEPRLNFDIEPGAYIDYATRKNRLAVLLKSGNIDDKNSSSSSGSSDSSSSSSGHKNMRPVMNISFFSPVTLHVNFCVNKQRGLADRGLWLYREYLRTFSAATATSSSIHNNNNISISATSTSSGHCVPFDIRKTPYARWRWADMLAQAHLELENELQKLLSLSLPPSSLPRSDSNVTSSYSTNKKDILLLFPTSGVVYLLENNNSTATGVGAVLRPIPNREMFIKKGYQFEDITHAKNPLLLFAPIGEPLTD